MEVGDRQCRSLPLDLEKTSVSPANVLAPLPAPQMAIVSEVAKSKRDCVIFSHRIFNHGGLEERRGAEEDVKKVKSTFQRLGFRCQTYEDRKTCEVKQALEKAANEAKEDADCFVCIFMSHGELGKCATYDGMLSHEDIMEPILKAEALRGKHKLFFFQTCQVLPKVHEGDFKTVKTGWAFPVPSRPGLFVGFATPPGYYAYRHEETGSPFIQKLCEVFDEHALSTPRKDLVWLMTRVNSQMAHTFVTESQHPDFHNKKQASCFVSCLTEKMYFRPPEDETIPRR